MYEGLIVKESLTDDSILDLVSVDSVELWKSDGTPRYWTAIRFTGDCADFPRRLSEALRPPSEGETLWYVDMRDGNRKLIVFHGSVLEYEIGDAAGRAEAVEACRRMGIPDEQLDWAD